MDKDLLASLAEEAEADAAPPQEDSLKRLQLLGHQAAALETEIEELEEALSSKKKALRSLLEREMVELLDDVQVPSITVGDRVFNVSDYCKASIKTDDPSSEEAYNWLEDNNAGDLIKRDVIVSFPKEYKEEAEALVTLVKQRYQMADVALRRGVPWARLTSWVKEQRKLNILTLPMDLLGATVGRVVKINKVKKR